MKRSRFGIVVEMLEARSMLSVALASLPVPASSAHSSTVEKVKAKAVPTPSFPAYSISLGISQDSDPAGSGNVFQGNVLLQGQAQPYSTVWLAVGPLGYFNNVVRTDYTGAYSAELPVGNGTTEIRAFAENPYQDYSNVATVHVTRGNAVVAWDSIAIRAIRNQNLSPDEASRDLAILHSAQYDAVAAIDSPQAAVHVRFAAVRGSSDVAAANASAAWVLGTLFPSQIAAFQEAENAAVAGLPNKPSTTHGIALGQEVAKATLAARANDGSASTVTYTPSPALGLWKPTPPSYSPAVDAQWGQVTPFSIKSGSEFRPAAPPAIGSTAYDQALQQVALLGRSNSTTRTSDQSQAAQFWNDGPGTFTNPGHWNEIAEGLSISHGDSLLKDARLFAELDFAQADTAIAASDAKYAYSLWRPITAVQQADSTFTPLVETPSSPSYVSDSSAFGSASADVLAAMFGSKTKFTDNIYAETGVTRTYSSFAAAATENGLAQVYGGINFSFDVTAGATLGDQVAQAVLAGFPKK